MALEPPPSGAARRVSGPVDPPSDARDDPVTALVLRARDGDEDAFGRIYDLYAVRLYRFLRARVREPEDADDLLQTTFLRAIEALPRWEPRGAPFSAWLFRIARNAAIDRARGRRIDVGLEHAAETEAPDADPAERGSMRWDESLLRALAALTADQRDVIALRYFADLSGAEIARVLGKDAAAVRALQARGLAALRRAMDGKPERARGGIPAFASPAMEMRA